MKHPPTPKLRFISALGLLLASAIGTKAVATPAINAVNGALQHAQTVTLSGSGFGSKTSASPQLWDSVDNISSYHGLTDGQTIPTGSPHPWPANANSLIKLETGDPQHGTHSSKCYKGSGTGVKFNDKRITNTGRIYASWWFKPEINPNTQTQNGHSSKFLRLSNSGNVTGLTFSWTQMHNYVYRSDQGYCQNNGGGYWQSWTGLTGEWNHHETFMDGINRTYQISVNGQVITNAFWDACDPFDFDEVWQIGWDSGGSSTLPMTIWMDDIYIDNTPQRIMLCAGSQWATRGHCENQIPHSWSASSLAFTVNQGAFLAGQNLYLYVLDQSNQPNAAGYAVSMGDAAPTPTPDSLAPQAPVGLSAQSY